MLPYRTISEKQELIRSGKLSLLANVSFYLSRIRELASINAFTEVFESDALSVAEAIEYKIKSRRHGKLAGAVIAVKDVLSIKDKTLTCSSNILKDFKAVYTATSVQKLLDEDAVIIGKTNCDEFAMGSSNENSAFGTVKNPHNTDYVPGGSSGGSAAAVAAYMCDASLGTDTGGSIRQPASFCGIYGLKPTYSRVSRYGLTAFASSFDTVGPFSRSVEDSALLLDVLSGYDEKDSTSVTRQITGVYPVLHEKKKFTVGLPKEYLTEDLNPEIREKVDEAASLLKKAGHSVIEVSLPHTQYAIAVYYILATAEASSNLARFDGVRYGYRNEESRDPAGMYVSSRTAGFGKEVKRRIMLGTYVLSSGYYDAYYRKAQQVRQKIASDFRKVFTKVDLLLTPTTPGTAFKIGEKNNNPLEMYLSDIYTTSANLAGIPAMNIPAGKAKNGLPVGIQLLADQFNEEYILQAAMNFNKL
ncbi:MAG: Asp-tRNA(Asn)/Glu-tRNA(Gln) amidotransferase subunit GatA [Ignavibacteriaceae bacterium]|nr:Asp-tRNA(Asn)/Glu-tRNA(Gln) amidotransferase subunit GatA [Ignavibacteriaceae bacterium]